MTAVRRPEDMSPPSNDALSPPGVVRDDERGMDRREPVAVEARQVPGMAVQGRCSPSLQIVRRFDVLGLPSPWGCPNARGAIHRVAGSTTISALAPCRRMARIELGSMTASNGTPRSPVVMIGKRRTNRPGRSSASTTCRRPPTLTPPTVGLHGHLRAGPRRIPHEAHLPEHRNPSIGRQGDRRREGARPRARRGEATSAERRCSAGRPTSVATGRVADPVAGRAGSDHGSRPRTPALASLASTSSSAIGGTSGRIVAVLGAT